MRQTLCTAFVAAPIGNLPLERLPKSATGLELSMWPHAQSLCAECDEQHSCPSCRGLAWRQLLWHGCS
eukprot:2629835-Amphidinium_carterae.1